MDRIDIHIEVPKLSPEELMGKRVGESSSMVHKRVVAARERQVARMGGDGINCNAHMKSKQLREYCDMDAGTKELLKAAINQFSRLGPDSESQQNHRRFGREREDRTPSCGRGH